MIFPRARNHSMWTAVGAGAGTVVGTALDNSPVGLALSARTRTRAGDACRPARKRTS
jgi:hypothetical protein